MSKYGAFRLSATFGRLTFLIRCDNNPDFEIDRNGIINRMLWEGEVCASGYPPFLCVQDGHWTKGRKCRGDSVSIYATWFLHIKLLGKHLSVRAHYFLTFLIGSIPPSITPVLGFCQRSPGSSSRDAFWVLSFDQSKIFEITALSAYVSWSSRSLIDCWIKLSVCF